jgi:hypothetical protein
LLPRERATRAGRAAGDSAATSVRLGVLAKIYGPSWPASRERDLTVMKPGNLLAARIGRFGLAGNFLISTAFGADRVGLLEVIELGVAIQTFEFCSQIRHCALSFSKNNLEARDRSTVIWGCQPEVLGTFEEGSSSMCLARRIHRG